MMRTYLTVGGAYGRDYQSMDAARKDWNAGKDFIIVSVGSDMGRYINKQDADREPNLAINLRYARNMKLGQLKK